MKPLFILSTILLSLSSTLVASAAETKKNQKEQEPETLVLSDTLEYNDKSKTSTFTGNVILTRGLMRMTSDTLTVSEDSKGTKHGVATMNKGLVHILQERPAEYATIKAQGLKGKYEGEGEVFHLIGDAVVTRYVCGKAVDNVRGQEVIYNNANGTYRAVSKNGSKNGRVRSIAVPSGRIEAATQECRTKYKNKPMPSVIEQESSAS